MVLAILNSMAFAVPNGSLFNITRLGLIVNAISAAAAWLVLLKGRRDGWEQLSAFLVLFSIIHYMLIRNIIGVTVYGL